MSTDNYNSSAWNGEGIEAMELRLGATAAMLGADCYGMARLSSARPG